MAILSVIAFGSVVAALRVGRIVNFTVCKVGAHLLDANLASSYEGSLANTS